MSLAKILSISIALFSCASSLAAPKTWRSVAVGGLVGNVEGDAAWIELELQNYRNSPTAATIHAVRPSGAELDGFPVTHSFKAMEDCTLKVESNLRLQRDDIQPEQSAPEPCDGSLIFGGRFPCIPPTVIVVRPRRQTNVIDYMAIIMVEELAAKKPGLSVRATAQ